MNGTLITENKVCVDEGDDLVRRLGYLKALVLQVTTMGCFLDLIAEAYLLTWYLLSKTKICVWIRTVTWFVENLDPPSVVRTLSLALPAPIFLKIKILNSVWLDTKIHVRHT